MKPAILVAFDFTPASVCALEWAVALQRATGSPMRVLHVLHFPVGLADPGMPGPLPPEPDEITGLEGQVLEAVTSLGGSAHAKVRLTAERVAGAILQEAAAWPAELIAIGTHGRGRLARAVLGSVADEVVRGAMCPVVTFHAPVAAATR